MRVSPVSALALAACLATPGISSFAQTSKGILAGIAHDSTGAVVVGANVTATNLDTGDIRKTVTGKDGGYRLDALQPGRYKLQATQPGFQTFELGNLVVNASVVTSYDVTFSVGSDTTTVSVEANNTGINTENGQLAGVIDLKDISTLPVFSLNPIELALTVPGVQPVSQGGGFSNGINIQVNGARPRANNFLIDGQEINDVGIGGQAFQPQIPDIFQSVSVLTSVASAEFGRAGGAVVNSVTRAGTNTFHGEAFERYAGSGLNSIDGVSRQSPGFNKTRFDTHYYGFNAGGPIIRDKLFAFGGLILERSYGKQTPARLELPDANGYAQLQAIGGSQVALLNQYLQNGAYLNGFVTFPGNGIVSRLNVGALNGCPATGCIITTGYFQRPAANLNSPDTQWMYRIDFVPRPQDSFYVRYLHDRSSLSPDFFTNASALPGFDSQQGGPSELGAGGWTHVFGPHVVNELRAAETRVNFAFSPTAETLANPLYNLPVLSINHVNSLGFAHGSYPQGRGEDLYQVQDTISLTKGRQTIRAGFDIGRQIETDIVPINSYGTLTFAQGGTGNSALGNFLRNQLGPSGSATRTFGSNRADPHSWRSGIFAQDDIRLNPDLVVNLGIRYDYTTDPENSVAYPAIDPRNPYQPIATVIKVNNDFNNISPRFGFAYSPHGEGFFGNGKTVVRGGFGIYYDSYFSNFVTNAAVSAPNAVAGLLTQTTGNGLANASGLIGSITPNLTQRSSVTSVVNNLVNPYTYQYNLGVERALPGNNLVAVRYVGTLGKKLFANKQYNFFAPDGSGARLNTTRGVINARGNFASSEYNGGIAEFTHNFSHGLQIKANYVFSKDLDNASEIFTTDSAPTSYQANLGANGFAQEWGPSVYDHRNFVSIAYVWQPAGFQVGNGFGNAMLGIFTRHWTLSGIEQFQSGTYATFNNSGIDQNADGSTANDRPILGNRSQPLESAGIDGHFVGGTTGTYYDMAANNQTGALNVVSPNQVHWLIPYQPRNQNIYQEIGRNSYSNPGTTINNIAIEKSIGTSYLHLERGRITLRAEAQNFPNHNDVGILDINTLDIGSGNFLNRPNARAGTNRNLYLWAKFSF